MIYTKVKGRLGNQMFYYAIARKIQSISKNEQKLYFDFSGVLQQGDAKEGFEDSLKYFNTVEYQKNDTEHTQISLKKQGTIIQKITYAGFKILMKLKNKHMQTVQWKYQLFMNKVGEYMAIPAICPQRIYTEIKSSGEKDIFVDGCYENSRWFNDMKTELQKEFTPRYSKIEDNKKLYDVIENTESVCVSIRRGDYVNNLENEKIFNICSQEYYLKAIAIMQEKIENPVFVIFSDDIEWARENIKIEGKVFFETGKDPVWEKLRLMYSCKHFIISNSTFSWWAQYLSRNSEKIVISPNIWFKPNIEWPLIEPSFLTIDMRQVEQKR